MNMPCYCFFVCGWVFALIRERLTGLGLIKVVDKLPISLSLSFLPHLTSRFNLWPGGSLRECYDEWGTRYSIPVYCLSNPLNLVLESDRDSPAEFSEPVPSSASSGGQVQGNQGEELKVKVRLSTTGEDIRLVLNTMETIGMAKKKLQDQEGVQEPSRQRWYFGGKLLGTALKW